VGTVAYVPDSSIAGHTATVTSGDTGFLVLTNITGLQVQASFSEDDTATLKLGQGATVALNALPNTPVNASVTWIASTGTSSSGVVSYTVDLDLKNPPAGLKPGQSGSVSVILKEADNTLYVPSTAVTTAGGVSTVTLVNGSTRTPKVVTVGVVGDTTTEIKSGLSAGDTVALTTATTGSSGFPTGGFPAGGRGGTGGLTGGGLGAGLGGAATTGGKG
jgi:macrolide-specific efflux system membrane fusion protein